MFCFGLKSPLSVVVLMFSVLVTAGCIRYKSVEPEAVTPSAAAIEPVDPGETYQVEFETSKGNFIIEVSPGWAPLGAARFKELVMSGYYNECRFFRVVPRFVVQWGMNGDPKVNEKWTSQQILDDKVNQSNVRGTVTFAMSGKNTRTTQLFVNLGDNGGSGASLDKQGFSPFGTVVQGMDIIEAINDEYGDTPDQMKITQQGNTYLKRAYPRLDYIIKATILDSADEVKVGEEIGRTEDGEPGKQSEKEEVKTATDDKKEEKTESGSVKEKETEKPETIEEVK